MKNYIAVFYEYDSALRFSRKCADEGIKAGIIPVPKRLNPYCKYGVKFEESDSFVYYGDPYGEVEQIVRINANKFEEIYSAEDDDN